MEATSFSARRIASSTLPGFSLPPPNTYVLSMASLPPHVVFSRASLTSSSGASDGLSSGLSSINTASSQGSQAATASLQYTYSNNWPPSTASPYHVTPSQTGHSYSTSAAPPLSGYHGSASSLHPLVYGHGHAYVQHGHHGQSSHQSDRSYKCKTCVQSFSRNHDLERHKRIHFSVKPFPCEGCSKSFSRKDALKRHRLVKGCERKTADLVAAAQSAAAKGRS